MSDKPKEPKAWTRPRLYFQEAPGSIERLRIIYPNGRSQWMTTDSFWIEPCWAKDYHCKNIKDGDCYGIDDSAAAALKNMRAYDKIQRWPPADFLGEICPPARRKRLAFSCSLDGLFLFTF